MVSANTPSLPTFVLLPMMARVWWQATLYLVFRLMSPMAILRARIHSLPVIVSLCCYKAPTS